MEKASLLLIFSVCLLIACSTPIPGSETQQEKTAEIQVFGDAKNNCKRDSGEPGLPDVLIAARANVHGTFTYMAQLTNEAGETSLKASFTHYFDLIALAPIV